MKKNDLFCVLNENGNVDGPRYAGLYYKDTRFLSSYFLDVNGKRPDLVAASLADDNTALSVRLSCQVLQPSGTICTIFLERTIYLSGSALCERIEFHSDSHESVNLSVESTIAADFSDIFEVRGDAPRKGRGHLEIETGNNSISIHTAGRDAIRRCAKIEFDPLPASLSASGAAAELSIAAGETVAIYVRFSCEPTGNNIDAAAFIAGLDDLRRERCARLANAVQIRTQDTDLNHWLARSVADLYMLTTDTDTGPYPYAGLPWFCAPFGRDGIITALQTLWMDPSIARGVLGFLARTQASDFSREHDAEPGKILHEARQGELANTGAVPFRRYYGSADATPLFVFLAGEYLQRTGDQQFVSGIWPAIENALRWIDRYGDVDGDGFVEYQRMTDSGLRNQGWRDSIDSVFHADGSLAEGPIAICEVQAYVYAAKRAAARIAASLGNAQTAQQLADEASHLQSIFENKFWSDDLDFYVLALDGDKRQCAVRSSNAGHLLLTEILQPERAHVLAESLCRPSFFSGWGIRTIADSEALYDPLSYHNGSVWPHDTSLIAMGLAKYGLTKRVEQIFQGMLEAATYFDAYRLPELFSGDQREAGGPVPFSHACAPQAWSAGTPFALLAAILGIEFDAGRKRVCFRQPRLPSFLDTLQLSSLGMDGATADVKIERDGDAIKLIIDDKRNEIDVAIIDSHDKQASVFS